MATFLFNVFNNKHFKSIMKPCTVPHRVVILTKRLSLTASNSAIEICIILRMVRYFDNSTIRWRGYSCSLGIICISKSSCVWGSSTRCTHARYIQYVALLSCNFSWLGALPRSTRIPNCSTSSPRQFQLLDFSTKVSQLLRYLLYFVFLIIHLLFSSNSSP
jgi:hypothetical protein